MKLKRAVLVHGMVLPFPETGSLQQFEDKDFDLSLESDAVRIMRKRDGTVRVIHSSNCWYEPAEPQKKER